MLYRGGSLVHEFSVRTNLEWELFQRLVRIYLGMVSSDDRIGYRAIQGGNLQALRHLRDAGDWERALHTVRMAAGQGNYEAMEVVNVSVLPSFSCP